MNSSQYRKSQLKFLCKALGIKLSELEIILNSIDTQYNEWFEQKINKATGDFKRYSDGTIKQRAIRPPKEKLKKIQSAIKNKILAKVSLPNNIHGGTKGKSNITNAKAHQGNKFQFTTDLQEFYPSIKYDRVYGMFLSLGYSNFISSFLTKLTTWKHELPQGAPTSTHIANLVFLETDKELIAFCQSQGLVYTRYIDDLTFSSQQDFAPLLNNILQIVKNSGFNISYRKTHYKGYQSITGIEVHNNFIDAPSKIKEKAAIELQLNCAEKPYSVYLSSIRKTNRRFKASPKNNGIFTPSPTPPTS